MLAKVAVSIVAMGTLVVGIHDARGQDMQVEALQGSWRLIECTHSSGRGWVGDTVVRIDDGTLQVTLDGKEASARIRVHTATGTPEFDVLGIGAFVVDDAPDSLVSLWPEGLGIFETDGDTLRICSTIFGERPVDFTPTRENDCTLWVFRRVDDE